MCPNFFQFLDVWNFHTLCTHSQPQEAPAGTQFAAGILHKRCSRRWTGNSMCSLSKSHLIAANSRAIRGSVCTLPYHSPTGSHLHLVSHLFPIQFKAACLGVLQGPFPAIFTDLVPTFSFPEVPGKISIDFNWTGCSACLFFFFFSFPLWQWNIPTTKFKTMGVWVACFVVKLKITPDFVRFASRKHLVCFPPEAHTSCVMGLSVKLLWIMHWG